MAHLYLKRTQRVMRICLCWMSRLAAPFQMNRLTWKIPGETPRMMFADFPLAGQDVGGYAARPKHRNKIALTQAAVFHQGLERLERVGMPEIVTL